MGFAKLAIDADLAANGVTVDLGNGESIRVARAGNQTFNKELRKAAKKYGTAFQSLGDEKLEQIVMDIYCRTVLLGWGGYEVEYSHAEAVKVMLDPANVEFRELVEKLASTNETFRREQIEAVVGE
jgi:hypothetical protein